MVPWHAQRMDRNKGLTWVDYYLFASNSMLEEGMVTGERKRTAACHARFTGGRPRLVPDSHSSVRLDLSHRLYPDPFSNVSNKYVARCARS